MVSTNQSINLLKQTRICVFKCYVLCVYHICSMLETFRPFVAQWTWLDLTWLYIKRACISTDKQNNASSASEKPGFNSLLHRQKSLTICEQQSTKTQNIKPPVMLHRLTNSYTL